MGGSTILLVEDNLGDVNLIEQAFDDRGLPGTLRTVETGEKALDWLYQRGEFAEAPRPGVVLLDLNLPATNGLAVLSEIKSDPDLKQIPVIILTGSRSETQAGDAYEVGANAYLIKPTDPREFADLVQRFAEFWIDAATLPPAADITDEE